MTTIPPYPLIVSTHIFLTQALNMGKVSALFVATLITVVGYHASSVLAMRSLRIVSPLQSLTIPDPEVKETAKSSRQKFVPKFKSGLQAEVAARRALAEQRTKQMQAAAIAGDDWAEEAASLESKRKTLEEKLVERAFDKATAAAEAGDSPASTSDKSQKNSYQFVGVVNPKNEQKPITWYARKKPTDAKWSVRLVHVNKNAIIKDLFNRGKVDLFAKYHNTGETDEETNTPIITKKYQVRERSWKYVRGLMYACVCVIIVHNVSLFGVFFLSISNPLRCIPTLFHLPAFFYIKINDKSTETFGTLIPEMFLPIHLVCIGGNVVYVPVCTPMAFQYMNRRIDTVMAAMVCIAYHPFNNSWAANQLVPKKRKKLLNA